MKTTLNISDVVLRAAKKHAAESGETLTSLVERALRQYLQPMAKPAKPFRLRLLTNRRRLVPGVNLDYRDSLYE